MTIMRIGLDTAKHVFQVHGIDENEETVIRRQLRRSEMGKFFNRLAPTRIGLEACGASISSRAFRLAGSPAFASAPGHPRRPATDAAVPDFWTADKLRADRSKKA